MKLKKINILLILCLFSAFFFSSCSNNPTNGTHIKAQDLYHKILAKDKILILDTRSESEYKSGHVPSAIFFPFWKSLWKSGDLKISKKVPIVIYCEHGPRAGIAKFSLLTYGFENITYLEGHMKNWKKLKLKMEK